MNGYWIDVNLATCCKGWRVAYLSPVNGDPVYRDLAGWLTQRFMVDETGLYDDIATKDETRVIPVIFHEGGFVDAREIPDYLHIEGPTEGEEYID